MGRVGGSWRRERMAVQQGEGVRQCDTAYSRKIDSELMWLWWWPGARSANYRAGHDGKHFKDASTASGARSSGAGQ